MLPLTALCINSTAAVFARVNSLCIIRRKTAAAVGRYSMDTLRIMNYDAADSN